MGAILPHVSPDLEALKPLVEKAISRRVYRHYLGLATSQLKAAQTPQGTSAKKLLYVLRTALTGAHALRTGRIVVDLRELHDDYGFSGAGELIAAKRAGETMKLSESVGARWLEEVRRAFEVLDASYRASTLPEEPPNVADLEAWLLAERWKRK